MKQILSSRRDFYNFIKTSTKSSKIGMIPDSNNLLWNYMVYSTPFTQFNDIFQTNFIVNSISDCSSLLPRGDTASNPTPNQLTIKNKRQERGNRSSETGTNATPTEVQKQKKIFKKDKNCPVRSCQRRYSSRIALRAHLRKEHPHWMEETSDYEP